MRNKFIKVGLSQKSFVDDIEINRKNNAVSIKSLASQGADIVVLSELHDSPYFCQCEDVENFKYSSSLDSFIEFYSSIAKKNHVVVVSSAFEKRAAGLYHNTAIIIDSDGSVAGKYRKMHIPDDPGFYEKFYFTPGDLGFKPVKTSLGNLGVLVCWDQWFPEAARLMALEGAELLIYPTAIGWNMTDDNEEKKRQREAWITIQRAHAIANGIPVISVNRYGFEPDLSGHTTGIEFWGSSFVAGPQGEILHLCKTNDAEDSLVTIDMNRAENVRQWWPFLRDRRIENYEKILSRFVD